MRYSPLRLPTLRLAAAALWALTLAGPAAAQSGDLSYPTPIYSNEVTGRIAPRDIGDPRRTRHFYTFRGTEGDLVVTLESTELSGDVDVFTAGTLRPLLKITLLGAPTNATKSVFLRREETLVLRVEARAQAETEGSYRIRLGGSFAPAPAGLAEAPAPALPELSETERRGRGVRRVTSTGARIDEPAPPPEEAKAEPTPPPDAEAAERAPERPRAEREPPRNTRRGRGTTNTNRRRGRARPTPTPETAREGEAADPARGAATTDPPAATGTGEAAPEAARAPRPTSRRNRSRPARRTAPPDRAGAGEGTAGAAPAPAPEAPGQRLVIVTKDGDTIERDMRTVRRVTVDNNQVVIVTRDGRTIRTPLANVTRMTIEPGSPQ